MTIYILSEDMKQCAEWLDDRSLDRMIHDIAHVLKGVHRNKFVISAGLDSWTKWAKECRVNYWHLVKLGLICQKEVSNRGLHNKTVKSEEVLWWARDNIPAIRPFKYSEYLENPLFR